MCHRVQHQSWAASPHAAKGIDCETCHGPGADYWPAAVMRDRAKATAAGLVTPDLASCKKCHPKADEALFAQVHAHKAK
jgi:formate-dependent nitrite reductase cytochrome c552 subunit